MQSELHFVAYKNHGKDTWVIGLRYLRQLQDVDFEKLESEILDYDIQCCKDAEEIWNLIPTLDLPNSLALQKKLASKYGEYL